LWGFNNPQKGVLEDQLFSIDPQKKNGKPHDVVQLQMEKHDLLRNKWNRIFFSEN